MAYTAGVSAAHEHVNPGAVHFYERVYALVARVPAGRVTTYGDLALALGWPRHARLVGYALARCPDDIPAHRVVNHRGEASRACAGSVWEAAAAPCSGASMTKRRWRTCCSAPTCAC